MSMFQVLREQQSAQTSDRRTWDHPTAEVAHDSIVRVDMGGAYLALRGAVSVPEDDGVVSLWRTMYRTAGGAEKTTTSANGNRIPENATDAWHSKYPVHFPIDRVAVVEWAVNDYAEGI